MQISTRDWKAFVDKLTALDKKAAGSIVDWVQKNGFGDTQALIGYAFGVATKYGEGSAALTAEMYDVIAELSGMFLEPAVMAETATFHEVAQTVNGVLMKSQNLEMLGTAIGRLVKLAGADTMLQNAKRDGAQFAWVPQGDTCAFCITIASRGWVNARDIKSKHAEHIHGNCDCMYSVRFHPDDGVKGYDPEKYKRIYYDADLQGQPATSKNRINAMRREAYAENKEKINAQKRSAYQKRQELNSSAAEEINV